MKVIMHAPKPFSINSSKKCGFESHDRTKGFHRKTARQNRSQTDNHHLRQSFIWQLSLCGNYTLIFDPENAPYIRDRQDVLRLLSMNSGHHKVKKRANHHRRRFWTRPGRTSAWWDNFINGTMIDLYVSAYFFLTFSVDLDIFSSDKLQASTVYTSQ